MLPGGAEADLVAGAQAALALLGVADDHGRAVDVAVQVAFVAQPLDRPHGGGHALAAVAGSRSDVLGPQADHHLGAVGDLDVGRREPAAAHLHPDPVSRVADQPRQRVHGWAADEPGDEQVRRLVVHVAGRAHLLEPAVLEHGDPVGHGHRLDLVVGDVDDGGGQLPVELDQLHPGLGPQLGVEVRQRLVHEEDLGPPDDGAGERHPLALAAREGAGLAVEQLAEPEDASGLGDPLGPLGLAQLARLAAVDGVGPGLERHLDVLPHRHVRVERVALEHHGDVALLGLHVVDDGVADAQVALGDRLQSGDHPQRGGLAAAGGAEEDHELAVADLEGHRVHRGDVAEALRHLVERDPAHGRLTRRNLPSTGAGLDQV